MMVYRDMTFCDAKCANTQCPKKLTLKVLAHAKAWWGSDDAPIAVSDYSETCEKYKELK